MTNWEQGKSDEELYTEMISGDKERAFRVLYLRHSGPLLRFIYRFTLNQAAAEELVQDIFENLLSGKLDIGQELHVKPWLYVLAKNKSLNFLKKAAKEIKDEVIVSSAMSNAVDDTDVESAVQQRHLLKHLDLVENNLPKELLETWNLRKSGLDYQQISASLSIPVGTVKSRFSRIVEFLKKEFTS